MQDSSSYCVKAIYIVENLVQILITHLKELKEYEQGCM